MYSLQHGVNLSRRACRPKQGYTISIVFFLFVVFECAASPTQQTYTETAGTYRPNAPPDIIRPIDNSDTHKAYPGMQFGPMGPIQKTGALSSELVKHEPLQQQTPSTDVQGAKVHAVERYKLMTFDFGRVETPFLIGLWIFSASLAKIGK